MADDDSGPPGSATALAAPPTPASDSPSASLSDQVASASPDAAAPALTPPGQDADAGDGTGEEGDEPPPWGALASEDEVLDHERIKPRGEARIEEAREAAREEALDLQARMDDYLSTVRTDTRASAEKAGAALGRLDRLVDDLDEQMAEAIKLGRLEKSDARRMTDDLAPQIKALQETLQTLAGNRERAGTFVGETGAITSLLAVAGAPESQMKRLVARVQRVYTEPGHKDEALGQDIITQITKAAQKPLHDEIAELKAQNTRLQAEQRNGRRTADNPNPPAGAPGRSGGKSDREKLLDPNTPRDELRTIRARQRAGG